MNFNNTHILQSSAALRKESRRKLAPLSLRCDKDTSTTLSPKPLRELHSAELERLASFPSSWESEQSASLGWEQQWKAYAQHSRELITTVKSCLLDARPESDGISHLKSLLKTYLERFELARGAAESYNAVKGTVEAFLSQSELDETRAEEDKEFEGALLGRLTTAEAALDGEEAMHLG